MTTQARRDAIVGACARAAHEAVVAFVAAMPGEPEWTCYQHGASCREAGYLADKILSGACASPEGLTDGLTPFAKLPLTQQAVRRLFFDVVRVMARAFGHEAEAPRWVFLYREGGELREVVVAAMTQETATRMFFARHAHATDLHIRPLDDGGIAP